MGKPITFDLLPIPTRAVTIARFVVALPWLAILLSGLVFGGYGANAIVRFAFPLLFLLMLATEIHAIVRHTRFAVTDLLVVVAVCGSVAGVILRLFAEPERYVDGTPVYRPVPTKEAFYAAIFFWSVLHGCYKGLRLAMWLQTERFVNRAEFLLLGVAGVLSSLAWMILAALCVLSVLELLIDPGRESLVVAIVCGLMAPLFYVIARAHLAYRRIAQERFDADPGALGPAGRLEPVGGAYRMGDLFRALKRLAGIPPAEKNRRR